MIAMLEEIQICKLSEEYDPIILIQRSKCDKWQYLIKEQQSTDDINPEWMQRLSSSFVLVVTEKIHETYPEKATQITHDHQRHIGTIWTFLTFAKSIRRFIESTQT